MNTLSYPECLVRQYHIKADQKYKQNRDASPNERNEDGIGIGGIGRRTFLAARHYAPTWESRAKKNWDAMPVIVAE